MTGSQIVVLTTGGTIASTHNSTVLDSLTTDSRILVPEAVGGVTPTLSGADLLQLLPTEHPFCRRHEDLTVVVRDVYQKDSSQLLPADLDMVAAAVQEALQEGAAGIVVVHGTDTLESTAMWLHLVAPVADYGCPVVLTGAAFSADSPYADGPTNLADALDYVSQPGCAPGVGIVFGGKYVPAWGAVKTATDQAEAFASTMVSPLSPNALHSPTVPLAASPEGPLGTLRLLPAPVLGESTPRVQVVAVDYGDDGSLLRLAVEGNAQHPAPGSCPLAGLVVEGMGSGNLPVAAAEELLSLQREYPELLIVVTSRVPLGPVEAAYGCPGGGATLAAQGMLLSGPLRAAQCRMLLIALLQSGYRPAEIRQLWAS